MIRRLLVLLSLTGCAVCLMCYQCADSSGEKGKNDCQTYVRTMRKYRRIFNETGNIGKYIKNCSDFGKLDETETYCYIASVIAGGTGEVRSYIRDCSDGKSFFGTNFNELLGPDNVINDNQTTCMYYPQGYLACVTLCGPTEDFCNGPTASATWNKMSVILVLLSIINMLKLACC